MDQNEMTEKQCFELLRYIFSGRNELLLKIAPNGWVNAEVVKIFHPTAEQQFHECKRMQDNLNRPKSDRKKLEIPELETFAQDILENINEQIEFDYALGLCVYDIFSNNHTVLADDKKEFNLGSMRGSGRFISNFFNLEIDSTQKKYDYIDFYMGSIWIAERADLIPFYEYIFLKLKIKECDWQYEFPRLYAIAPPKIHKKKDDNLTYNPNDSISDQIAEDQEEKESNRFQEVLNTTFEEAFEGAKYKPLTAVVQAYKNIFGVLPDGHPQKALE
jgi:hypothetical protein